MPHHIIPEVCEKAPQDTPSLAPGARRQHVTSVLRASWCLLRHWQAGLRHRPPEMHAMDHMARDYPAAFV